MNDDVFAKAVDDLTEALTVRLGEGKGLRHPRHVKTIKRARAAVERVISGYFRRQQAAVLKAARPKIGPALQLHPPPLAEALRKLRFKLSPTIDDAMAAISEASKRTPVARQFAASVMPSSLSPLRFPATSSEISEYDSAIGAAIAGAAATAAKELQTDATLRDTASSRYLRENSLTKLTGELQKQTVERIQGALADAWQDGGSFDQFVSAIKDTFEDFSNTRAETIAQTEVNDAYNWGRVEIAKDGGFDEKAWDPDGEACEEICQPNVDAGWIGLDEEFPSGDDAPTAHPNCDCGISFRSTSGGDEE